MKRLLNRKVWEGPLGLARIVLILSAIWLMVTSFLVVIGVPGATNGKSVLPLSIMLLALGFVTGYQMGQSRRVWPADRPHPAPRADLPTSWGGE